MSIIIGIDHGYYAIKTAHCSFAAGLTSYGEHEPYTRQGLLEFGGCFFVCGSGRQPIQRDKTINDNYYLLTLAAIAKEIRQRGLPPECSVRIAAGLPLTSFGRDKPKFKDYLLRSNQPVNFKFEGVEYSITIEEVAVFPQGYAALMTEVGLLQDEPSMLLMDLGGWTVDLMRIDNAIPAADTAHSLELGMIRCVDDIREQVRRETGLSLTDAQIENMLAGQPCTVSDTVRDIVNKQGRKYTEHLLSATMEAGFDLHAINVQWDLKRDDFLSLTDIAKIKDSDNPRYIIQNWLRNRNTIEFLGVWETLYNPDFNRVEFDAFRSQAGLNSFVMTPQKWVEATGAVGIVSKAGRYGGTYAHKEIAFEFASWISVEFKLYLVKEFERLKTEEMKQLGWDIKRNLAKINYRIHTDAIKENLIPPELSARQISLVYANEADVLNMALFGMTAKEWRDANPDLRGNIRDYANVSQLVCLSNLENLNAVFINEGMPQAERLAKLNAIAISQMKVLTEDHRLLQIEAAEE